MALSRGIMHTDFIFSLFYYIEFKRAKLVYGKKDRE